jgi:hypothetical protein
MGSRLLALIVSATAMTAFAGEETARVEPVQTAIGGEGQAQKRYLGVRIGAQPTAPVAQTEGLTATLAPAPPLSYVQVYAVGSTNVGWETLSNSSALSTTYDHGGANLYVEVLELGYGGNPIVKMNGGLLPSSANYATYSVCSDVYGNLYSPCNAGQTVAGWLRYYDVSGNQSGLFEYQNTSLNSPWNTMSDRISIR